MTQIQLITSTFRAKSLETRIEYSLTKFDEEWRKIHVDSQ